MIVWVKEVEKSEGVGVIVFHGVGGDYLSYPPKRTNSYSII